MRSFLIAALFASAAVQAADLEVVQKNRKFDKAVLNAKVGDTLVFRNDDPFFHNIFSLSPSQTFDLGSYPQGESRKVALKTEGLVEVECAIHPDMKLQVKVAK